MSRTQLDPAFNHHRLAGTFAVSHALLLIVVLSWHFGGMDPLARSFDAAMCTPGPFITWFAWRRAERAFRTRFLWIVAPLAAIALMVLVSVFNPSAHEVFAEGESVGFIPRTDFVRFLPSTIWPAETAKDFIFNAGLILAGLNLFLAQPSRGQQRVLLAVIAINTAVLACVGTVFKLGHASAVFGKFTSPNPRFFASFFYHNHWGAFALLGAAAAAALAFHYRQRSRETWLHTPAPLLGVLLLLILISLALSGARASLAAGLAFAAFLGVRTIFFRGGSRNGRTRRVSYTAAGLAVFVGALSWLAKDDLAQLVRKTSSQWDEMRGGGIGELRLMLYRDVLQLVREKPILGWGWRSFPQAYRRVQSIDIRQHNEQRGVTWFREAHNDWLQLLTELGAIGVALALATLVAIFRAAHGKWWRSSPSLEIVAGLSLLAMIAFVDFPFANPAVVVTAWALLLTAAAVACDRSRRGDTV